MSDVGAENFQPLRVRIARRWLIWECRRDFDFDFDFKILTAFIRLGRAGPAGAGCPPDYYYLTFARKNFNPPNVYTLKCPLAPVYIHNPFLSISIL
jgi:hypothetical protein